MILEVIFVNFVLSLQPFQVGDNLIFILFSWVFEIEFKFKLRKGLFGFGWIFDWRFDDVYFIGLLFDIGLDIFLVLLLLLVILGFGVDWLGDFVLISRPDHQIFWLIIC